MEHTANSYEVKKECQCLRLGKKVTVTQTYVDLGQFKLKGRVLCDASAQCAGTDCEVMGGEKSYWQDQSAQEEKKE